MVGDFMDENGKQKLTKPMYTIECPRCCHEDEYDPDNDVILCEECDEMIFIPETSLPE